MKVSQEQDSSQTPEDNSENSRAAAQQEDSQNKTLQKHRAFVIAPLPISSPALGAGVVPVLAYIFPASFGDKTSPPSLVGAVGLVTDNGSRAIALGGEVYFKQNTYRPQQSMLAGI